MPQSQPAVFGKEAIHSLYQSVFREYTVTGGGQTLEIEIGGDWAPVRATRGDEKPKREYVVHVELDAPAYLTWLYLDWTRQLQLPKGARQEVVQAPAEPQQFEVTLGLDEPPGPQWIAAVASEQPFDAFELRGELQAVVDDLPKEAPFDDAVARLKEALREHEALTFRSHRFMVPADEAP